MTTSVSETDALINAHPQAEQIRLVQRTAYRAFSRTHKLGLDAISWLAGPMAPMGFAAVDSHRDAQAMECRRAVCQLLRQMGNSVQDRRVISVLLADYPGRSYEISTLLQAHLQQR